MSSAADSSTVTPAGALDAGARAVRAAPGIALPQRCACCGAVAGSSLRSRRVDGVTLIVPYCVDCARHIAAHDTRALAVAVASLVVGLTLSATLPLLLAHGSVGLTTAIAVVAAATPGAWLALVRQRPAAGHAATGPAVVWRSDGRVACASAPYATALAEAAGAAAEPCAFPVPRATSAWLGVVVALLVTPPWHLLHHPRLRILALSSTPLRVSLDGREVALVPPSSVESPSAGVDVRVPSGRHRLEARDVSGALVASAEVSVQSGARHLYAPAADDTCFWLETARYGRSGEDAVERRPLSGRSRFWVLPDVESWFSENPVRGNGAVEATGGTLTALRQARCSEAPSGAVP